MPQLKGVIKTPTGEPLDGATITKPPYTTVQGF